MHNLIWANHKSESFVNRWLRALTTIEVHVTHFLAFVGALYVISSVMSILYKVPRSPLGSHLKPVSIRLFDKREARDKAKAHVAKFT